MKLVFMGTPKAAVASLERILDAGHQVVAVYTQPDRPSGRGKKVAYSPIKEFAASHGLPVFQPSKLRTGEVLDEFREHKADLAVVVAYGRILPATYLEAFGMGAINVHFSLLPKYRGAAPVNWAIVNGETETGVTTMKMDAGLDTGDILMQNRIRIGPDDDSVVLMDRLSEIGADLVVETISRFASLKPQPQDNSEASLAPLMRKEDGVIDWSLSSKKIRDRIRGFQPFPTSHTTFRNLRLTLWKAEARSVAAITVKERLGTIIEAAGDSLVIECGSGTTLNILELQLEGKRRVGARDFINGLRPMVGDRLGN